MAVPTKPSAAPETTAIPEPATAAAPAAAAKHSGASAPSFGPTTLEGFQVELEVFQGPFDLLLQLISRRQLDVTRVALAEVTDEFIAYMNAYPDLTSATDFLVVAATLLDMKAAALLPREEAEEHDEDEFSARDLLFQRLLQYRAFKEAAAAMASRLAAYAGTVAREVPLEPQFAAILPELKWSADAEQLAQLAAAAMTPTPSPDEASHVTTFSASVPEEVGILVERLTRQSPQTFAQLIADAPNRAVLVARFLGLLEMFRRGIVQFVQENPMGTLSITYSKDGFSDTGN